MLATATAHAQERHIAKEAVIKAPLAAVWKAWTTNEGIQSFFAPEAVIEARPGGAYSVHFNPYAQPGLKGADDMRVLAVQENQFLSFTWNAPPHLPQAREQRTAVFVRFNAVDEGRTRVSIAHYGWGSGGQWDEAFNYFDKAWGNVLANLGKRFDQGPIDWAPWLQQLKK